jgi:hypothetical protein
MKNATSKLFTSLLPVIRLTACLKICSTGSMLFKHADPRLQTWPIKPLRRYAWQTIMRGESSMPKLGRRGFLKRTSVSVATLGVLASVPALTTESDVPEVAGTDLSQLSTAVVNEPMVAHIRDLASGEIALLVGEQEIIYRDPQLVMRLLQAVR